MPGYMGSTAKKIISRNITIKFRLYENGGCYSVKETDKA